MSEPAVIARDLTRRFGNFVAVDHINFEMQRGEVLGYLGPNGSGKTTTIRMLLGLLLPSEGSASVLGFDIRSQAEQVRAHLGYMSQKFALYNDLTVWENLEFYAGVYGVRERARMKRALEQVGIEKIKNSLTGGLSTGWRQRLALAAAIVHRPRLVFLDEPTGGVDPNARRQFWDLIYELVGEGMSVLVTTHYMDEAEYCQRVGIMRQGRLLALDAPTRLKEQILKGAAWVVQVGPLLQGLEVLEKLPGVQRVSLSGELLRVMAAPEIQAADLHSALQQAGLNAAEIRRVRPDLEDVFFALAGRNDTATSEAA